MESITCYKAKDGTVFEDATECQIYEQRKGALRELDDMIEASNCCYDGMDTDDMYLFITDNRDELIEVLQNIKKAEDAEKKSKKKRAK